MSLADKLKTLASVKKVTFVGTRGQDRE